MLGAVKGEAGEDRKNGVLGAQVVGQNAQGGPQTQKELEDEEEFAEIGLGLFAAIQVHAKAAQGHAGQIDRQDRGKGVGRGLDQDSDNPEPGNLISNGQKPGNGHQAVNHGGGQASPVRPGLWFAAVRRSSARAQAPGQPDTRGQDEIDGRRCVNARVQAEKRDNQVGRHQTTHGRAQGVDKIEETDRVKEVLHGPVIDFDQERQGDAHQDRWHTQKQGNVEKTEQIAGIRGVMAQGGDEGQADQAEKAQA